jgi:PHP family Zn ribbon phosphoesterase
MRHPSINYIKYLILEEKNVNSSLLQSDLPQAKETELTLLKNCCVMQRVEELAKRSDVELELYKENGITKSKKFPDKPGFRMLVQLEEILAESLGVAVKTQKVKTAYEKLVTELDSELKILTKVQIPLIEMAAGEKVAEGVRRVREGHLKIQPGYDNTYGIVKIFDEKEVTKMIEDQGGLF